MSKQQRGLTRFFAAASLLALSCDPQGDFSGEAGHALGQPGGVDLGADSGEHARSGEVFDDFSRPDSDELGRTPVGGWSWRGLGALSPVLHGETIRAPWAGEDRVAGVTLEGFALQSGRVSLELDVPEDSRCRLRLGRLEFAVRPEQIEILAGAALEEIDIDASEHKALEVEVSDETVTVWLGEQVIIGPTELSVAGGAVDVWLEGEASLDIFAFVPASDGEGAEGGEQRTSPGATAGSLGAGGGEPDPSSPGATFSASGGGGSGGGGGGDGGDGGAAPPIEVLADPPRSLPSPPPDADLTVPTTLNQMVRFTFDPCVQGAALSQTVPLDGQTGCPSATDFAPSAISLVYGHVRDTWGQPIPNALVSVRGKPEYGFTHTRADGTYDLVVPGGRATDIAIRHDDYLTVQRSTEVAAGDTERLDDAMMVEVDVEETLIDFSDPIQVHHSFTLNDGWSDRMVTLMFREDTTATMVFADGTTEVLVDPNAPVPPGEDPPFMTVRTTEFTVGEDGQERMPAKLPPGTGYNYALEISVDQAEAAGAVSVELDQPAVMYVDNFRNFPVGAFLANGSFSREDGRWHAEPTGIVLRVLDVDDGLANIDLNGNGEAEDPTLLGELGMTPEERQELASIYTYGAELWRVDINHFTPFDVNPNSGGDGLPPPEDLAPDEEGLPNSCEEDGSIIDVESRVLGEVLPLHGTPFSLNYRSDRVPGGPNRTLSMGIDDAYLASVDVAVLVVDVAGRRLKHQVFQPEPGARLEVTWDGLDAYGRAMQGAQPVTMCVAYGKLSENVIPLPPTTGGGGGGGGGGGSGATIPGGAGGEGVRFGQWPEGSFATHISNLPQYQFLVRCYGNGKSVAAAAAESITKADRYRLGGLDAALLSDGLGGWTLDAHHTLSRATATLHRGDGRDRELADEAVMTASRFAGLQEPGVTGMPPQGVLEGPATGVLMPTPEALAVGPDGSIYVGSPGLVRRIAPDGNTSIVAGTMAEISGGVVSSGTPAVIGVSGDGGPATAALLSSVIRGVTVDEDGQVYFGDSDRIRRVDISGTIETVAGGGTEAVPDERFPDPLGVDLITVNDVALAPDGQGVFIATGSSNTVRSVWLLTKDGELEFLAGSSKPAWVNLDKQFLDCTDTLCDPASVLGVWGPEAPFDWVPGLPTDGADDNDFGRSIYADVNSRVSSVAARNGRVYFAEAGTNAARRRIRTIEGYRGGKIGTFRRRTRLGDSFELPVLTSDDGIQIDDDLNGNDDAPLVLERDIDPPTVEDILAADLGLYYTTPYTGAGPGGLYFATDDLERQPQRIMGGPGAMAFVGGDDIRLADTVALGGSSDVVRGRDGALYVADRQRNVILRVARMVPPMYLSSWVTSQDGTEVFLFDEEGRHLETRDAQTHALIHSFAYDSEGLLASATDAFGDSTLFHRVGGTITGVEGPDGHLTTIAVGADGYIDSVTDPSGASSQVVHDATGLLAGLLDADSRHRYEYDARGRLVADQEVIAYLPPSGPMEEETIEQDLESQAVEEVSQGSVLFTTPEGRETTYAFQREGTDYERTVTFPDGTVTASTQTPEQDQVTYADGTVVTTQWEANERLGANTRAPASIRIQTPGSGDRVVTFVRGFEPRCTVHTEDAECGQPPVELPNLRADRISETTQSGSETWTRVYDRAHIDGGTSVPATIVSTAPSGRVITTTLNGDGQVASMQVGTLAPVIYSYDTRGRVSGISQTDGLEVRGVTFGYHATEGWLETVTDAENRTTTYQRDEIGRVLQQIAPNTEVVSFTYDEDGNVESVTPPSRPAHEFFYDSADRLREYAPPAVSGVADPETQYTYTPDHQPAVTSLPQSSDITYTHDPSTGKLSTIVTPEALYTFVHDDDGGVDDTGQLQSVSIDPDAMGLATNTLTYTYDGDLLTGEALTGNVTGSVAWGYDSQRRVDSETAGGDTVAYGYDSQGRMTSMGAMTATYVPTTGQLDTTTLSGVLATYSYDPFGDLAGILYEDGATAVYEVTYTRDSYGRIETKTETHSGSTALRCYEYDDADRLADVYDAADSMGCTGTNLESYSYDSNGNRSAVTNSAGTIGAGGIVTDNQDRLLTHGDWTYTYNDDGQMESRTETSSGDVWLYTYDVVGNLLEVDPPGMTDTISYIIDARNRRVGKRVDGVMVQQFLYGGQLNPVAELDGAGALVSRFVYGTSDHVPDYMVRGGTTYRFLTDQNGNVVGVYNTSTNTMAQTREYDAYGRVVGGGTTEVGFSQPFGFAGGLYDEDTGLVRFGARDYRPEVGSWAAKDPLRFGAGDTSLSNYCFGDPNNFLDVSGRAPTKNRAARDAIEAIKKDPRYGHQEAFCWICRKKNTLDWFATRVTWGGYDALEAASAFYDPPSHLVCKASLHTHAPDTPPKRNRFGTFDRPLDQFSRDDIQTIPQICARYGVCVAFVEGALGTVWKMKRFWGVGEWKQISK